MGILAVGAGLLGVGLRALCQPPPQQPYIQVNPLRQKVKAAAAMNRKKTLGGKLATFPRHRVTT